MFYSKDQFKKKKSIPQKRRDISINSHLSHASMGGSTV